MNQSSISNSKVVIKWLLWAVLILVVLGDGILVWYWWTNKPEFSQAQYQEIQKSLETMQDMATKIPAVTDNKPIDITSVTPEQAQQQVSFAEQYSDALQAMRSSVIFQQNNDFKNLYNTMTKINDYGSSTEEFSGSILVFTTMSEKCSFTSEQLITVEDAKEFRKLTRPCEEYVAQHQQVAAADFNKDIYQVAAKMRLHQFDLYEKALIANQAGDLEKANEYVDKMSQSEEDARNELQKNTSGKMYSNAVNPRDEIKKLLTYITDHSNNRLRPSPF